MGVDRQQDLQSATMAGRPEEVGRISQLIIQGAQEWHGAILAQGALLLRVTEGTFWSFFFAPKGWSTLEVPDGWLQVVRDFPQ